MRMRELMETLGFDDLTPDMFSHDELHGLASELHMHDKYTTNLDAKLVSERDGGSIPAYTRGETNPIIKINRNDSGQIHEITLSKDTTEEGVGIKVIKHVVNGAEGGDMDNYDTHKYSHLDDASAEIAHAVFGGWVR